MKQFDNFWDKCRGHFGDNFEDNFGDNFWNNFGENSGDNLGYNFWDTYGDNYLNDNISHILPIGISFSKKTMDSTEYQLIISNGTILTTHCNKA